MLSYMLPVVEEKPSPLRNINLQLNLNSSAAVMSSPMAANITSINGNSCENCDENAKLLISERENFIKSNLNENLDNNFDKYETDCKKNDVFERGFCINDTSDNENVSKNLTNNKKGKINKFGTKKVTLKRVSFGSSKGSMVETLVFETPTPLSEHAECDFSFSSDTLTATQNLSCSKISTNHNNNNNNLCLDDSGIEMQEESERSKVRVTFYQSSKPQQISPPKSYPNFADSILPFLPEKFETEGSILNEEVMPINTATQPDYDRQISTESGWDNPFRPGGDLSREADEIVSMIKGGKPITPTSDTNETIVNGTGEMQSNGNGTTIIEEATKIEVSNNKSTPALNGTKSPQPKTTKGNTANGETKSTTPQTQVSNQVIPGPISASHVVIEDKKKKKCTCCVIQ